MNERRMNRLIKLYVYSDDDDDDDEVTT